MKLCVVLIALALVSCGEPTSSAEVNTSAPVNQEPTASEQVQAFPISYYQAAEASGSWNLEMSMEQNGSFTVVFKEVGSGSQYQGSFQKSPPIVDGKVVVEGNETLFNGVLEGASSGLSATIRIKGEECKSQNGSINNSTCRLEFDNKTYTGCGKYLD